MSKNEWTEWCRLCGRKNGSAIDTRFKLENTEILDAATKYFGIIISEENNYTKICMICHDTISSIIKYNVHASKVNEMFLELESNHLNQHFDVESLREKYGLNNETCTLYENEMRAADFCSVQVNVELTSESKNKINALPSKCFLKTEIVNVNELNFLEEVNAFVDESNDALINEFHIDQTTIGGCLKLNKIEQDAMNFVQDGERKIVNLKNNEEKCFECNICQKRFVTARRRTIHMKQKHFVISDPRPYKCDACGKLFKRIQHLNAHQVAHLSENERILYDCPQCSKKFTREWSVKHHIRIVHKGDRPFICELCGAAFGNKRNMIDHHVTHSEEKKFKCPKCEKSFKCKRSLEFHVDIHNDTEYVCPICNLKLNTKMTLQRHMIVHSDKNKYKCNFCLKQFKRTYAFKNHLILHTGLKPYQCPFCDVTFANGANCRKHQTTVHSGELSVTKLKGKQKIIQNIPTIKQLKAINDEALTDKMLK